VLESAKPIDTDSFIQYLKRHLPAYHAPKEIRVQAAFKRTATGKLVRG
jgi:acyl-CoA synthetase (AMP-forming)/AMP-acid ligase II